MGCLCYDTSVKYRVAVHDYDGKSKRVLIDEEDLTSLYYPAKTGEGETMNFVELHLQGDGGEVYVNVTRIACLRQIVDNYGKALYTKVCTTDSDEDYCVRETPEEIFEKMRKSIAINVF